VIAWQKASISVSAICWSHSSNEFVIIENLTNRCKVFEFDNDEIRIVHEVPATSAVCSAGSFVNLYLCEFLLFVTIVVSQFLGQALVSLSDLQMALCKFCILVHTQLTALFRFTLKFPLHFLTLCAKFIKFLVGLS
jgi:hypothetical protein